MGLYLKISIVLFYIILFLICFLVKSSKNFKNKKGVNKLSKIFSIKRYVRYIKIFFSKKMIIMILLVSSISNTIVLYKNIKYENSFKDEEKYNLIGVIVSERIEKKYNDLYKFKYDGITIYLKVDKDRNLNYGEKIKIEGTYIKSTERRNYGGFDYSDYLKSVNIYGTIEVDKIEVVDKNKGNIFIKLINDIKKLIKEKIDLVVNEESSEMIKGLLLGDKTGIEEEIQENFKITNLSHILAVSGMHVSYIILGLSYMLNFSLGKNKARYIIIIFLFIYMFIVGATPSIVRAVTMSIMIILSKIVFRKNDVWTSLSLSLLLILISNPYSLGNIGLQLSYLGTMGIILFQKNIHLKLRKIKIRNKKIKYNRRLIILIDKIKEVLSVMFSAQIAIFPVMIFHFNIFSPYFIITNLLVSLIIAPIIILSFIIVVSSFIFIPIAKIFGVFIEILISILILISNISKFPFSKIYLPTMKVWQIIMYYFICFFINFIYVINNKKKTVYTYIRLKNYLSYIKYQILKNKTKVITIFSIIIVIFVSIKIIPKELKIHFVDVGQGDCTFIETPMRKTILIDGGGSYDNEYDVGEKTLLPYILDRGYTRIDYVFVSHFDTDHIGGLIHILGNINVGKVIITKQGKDSEKYKEFLEIVKRKKIKVIMVKAGDKINIEKNIVIDILWPNNELIQENILNNNSMVFKLNYKKFDMLFVGDIEEKAENKILEKYKNEEKRLKADVLKIAHHGSKTSSTEEFIKKVLPKNAIIGVGKNNLFGHPSMEVIERLKEFGIKIYRTDECGEITITVNNRGEILVVKKCIR